MITLPTERRAPTMVNPRKLVMFGQSKVGKTTMLSELDNCLIIDTEKGSDFISGHIVNVNTLTELSELKQALVDSDHKYDYIALDVIDQVVLWAEAYIVAQSGPTVTTIGDLPYGAGYAQVREMIMQIIHSFASVTTHLIIIGHRKRTIIGAESVEFSADTLDLSGKLKNFVCADADAIGYVYRQPMDDGTQQLRISFKTTNEIEVGSRVAHLKGQDIEFDWKLIYV